MSCLSDLFQWRIVSKEKEISSIYTFHEPNIHPGGGGGIEPPTSELNMIAVCSLLNVQYPE